MSGMPDVQMMQQYFGKSGALAEAKNTHARMIEKERTGRLMREAQVATNTTYQWRTLATFEAGEAGSGKRTDWISFGHIKFTKEPFLATGSKAAVKGLAGDGENADDLEIWPAMAMVVAWKIDGQGRYVGARLKLFAFGSIPVDYQVVIYGVFTGPAIRAGD